MCLQIQPYSWPQVAELQKSIQLAVDVLTPTQCITTKSNCAISQFGNTNWECSLEIADTHKHAISQLRHLGNANCLFYFEVVILYEITYLDSRTLHILLVRLFIKSCRISFKYLSTYKEQKCLACINCHKCKVLFHSKDHVQ